MPKHEASPHVGAADSPSDRDASPVCLSCGQDTQHVRTIQNLGILPEILVFRCPACHSVSAVQPTGIRRSVSSKK
jgi:hypothetical protein